MEFETVLLKNILEINPKTVLKKGTLAKKVAMENIKENLKHIKNYSLETFKSGAKFKNGDTLVARITPCLENGKTAYVDILEDDEVAFGSTEFFVIRPKQHKADSQFLYYLMRTPYIREILIKSMTGTSGRQRAQKDSLLDLQIDLPKYECQVVIGKLLSNLDDKIRLNSQLTAKLEELSQTLFNRWFLDFEFPDENGKPYKSNGGSFKNTELGYIPSQFRVYTIDELLKLKYGKEMPLNKLKPSGYPVFGANGIIGFTSTPIYEDEQVIITCRGNGSGDIFTTNKNSFVTNNCLVLEHQKNFSPLFLKFLIKHHDPYRYVTGSAQPQITITNLSKMKVVFPTEAIISKYDKLTNSLFTKMKRENSDNDLITSLRDTLLPKLMSGEIELPDNLEVTEDAELLQRG